MAVVDEFAAQCLQDIYLLIVSGAFQIIHQSQKVGGDVHTLIPFRKNLTAHTDLKICCLSASERKCMKMDSIRNAMKRIDPNNQWVEICLYRYAFEFSRYKLLANTVIPWIVEWLFYYEIWLTTGEWLGGGEHPQSEKRR